jgi:hypothetical protein
MIVVTLMGVVYSLAINNFAKLSDEGARVTLKSLKEYLGGLSREREAKLLCLDDCSECGVYVDGEKTTTLEDFLDDKVEIYRYDFAYGFTKTQPNVHFNEDDVEERVCFSYSVDKNGVGDQVLARFKDKFYDFSPYLGEVALYDSLSEANNARRELARAVSR